MSIVALTEICFSEVRSFEAFTHLHAGIISDLKCKTLPAIAEIMGLENAQ
jgi:SRSO17 transposase